MEIQPQPLRSRFLPYWLALKHRLQDLQNDTVTIDGRSLDIPSIVAVARHGKQVDIHPQALKSLQAAVDRIHNKLAEGEIIYGINTGFGGSASSRPSNVYGVQNSLMRVLHYGILANEQTDGNSRRIDETGSATSMPESWVRAAMAIRMNSLSKGVSGVRPLLLQNMAAALNDDIVPLVPLRGSISASGDLSPLSYIGGMLQGKPAIRVYAGKGSERHLMGADEALAKAHIEPVSLLPKEGLAVVNGTAISGAVGALAMFEAHSLAACSQVLTAMSVDALKGSIESFDPFFAEVRPHPGQIEAASNIRHFLAGSKMAVNCSQREETQQDRYSIRTASQWLGPVLEDLSLADKQIHIEANSVTDNPLITPDSRMLHGGNFQAKSVTSAMEKIRQGCESIGQMLFTQATELLNPNTSNGLSPNLVVDEPHDSWLWKGTDIMIASLTSELGFLANNAGNHVKAAEMGNQALNSLALISARYTLTALDVLTQLSAIHTLICCQAMDLRALDAVFTSSLRPLFTSSILDHLAPTIKPTLSYELLEQALWTGFLAFWAANKSMNTSNRITAALDSLDSTVLKHCTRSTATLDALDAWKSSVESSANKLYFDTRREYIAAPNAEPLLGAASSRVYAFVRRTLKIPFVGEDYLADAEWRGSYTRPETPGGAPGYGSLGSMITAVYGAMKDGVFYDVVAACHAEAVEDALREERGVVVRASKL